MSFKTLSVMLAVFFVLVAGSACASGAATATVAMPTATATVPEPTPSPSPTVVVPTATPTAVVTPTAPTPTVVAGASLEDQLGPLPDLGAGTYLDDRSTPQGVILSFYNAINRSEYLRAYWYWESGAEGLPSLEQFQNQYSDVGSVQVATGLVGADAGAGQVYYTVPAVVSLEQGGTPQLSTSCFVLHLANPAIQGTPPFQPLAIRSMDQQPVAPDSDLAAALAAACDLADVSQPPPMEPQPTTDPSTIAADNYLDDRSTGVDVLSSLFNAINSHEYVRAYSYWQPNAQGLAPFDQFQQGYADTQSVEVTFGTPIPDLGAGQTRSHVPVLLVARTAQGGSQTYVGCYTTHLGLPSAQAIPPFQPTAIESASVRRVPPGANTDKLLQDVCSQYQ